MLPAPPRRTGRPLAEEGDTWLTCGHGRRDVSSPWPAVVLACVESELICLVASSCPSLHPDLLFSAPSSPPPPSPSPSPVLLCHAGPLLSQAGQQQPPSAGGRGGQHRRASAAALRPVPRGQRGLRLRLRLRLAPPLHHRLSVSPQQTRARQRRRRACGGRRISTRGSMACAASTWAGEGDESCDKPAGQPEARCVQPSVASKLGVCLVLR